jgi:intraflagellar transport protein 122
VLFAAAKVGLQLGAYKLARHAYEKLQKMRVGPARNTKPQRSVAHFHLHEARTFLCSPSRYACAQISDAFREHVDVGALSVRSKPLTDAEELLPLCYRCSSQNPLLGGNSCTVCKHPLITSAHSREFLPLVEFAPEEGLGPVVVSRLIENDTTHGSKRKASGDAGDAQVMSLEDGDDDEDPFLSQLSEYEAGRDVYEPIVATREMLKAMPSTAVFRQGSLDGGDPRFFYNILPEMGVSMCHTCNRVRGEKWEGGAGVWVLGTGMRCGYHAFLCSDRHLPSPLVIALCHHSSSPLKTGNC